jgi:hypothetical protein
MYSNPKNKLEDRIEFLEETIEAIRKLLVHMGAEDYQQDMPFEQWVALEFQYKKDKSNLLNLS